LASQPNRHVGDVALAASGADTCPLHAVFSILYFGEHETPCNSSRSTTWTTLYDLDNVSTSTFKLASRSAVMRTPGSTSYLKMSGKLQTLLGLVFYGSLKVSGIQPQYELHYCHKNRTHTISVYCANENVYGIVNLTRQYVRD
jgi:hypothetical protein